MSDAIDELARELSRRVRERRLNRAGLLREDDTGGVPFERLPHDDQENWRTLAEIVLERDSDLPPSAKLRSLCADYDRHTRVLCHDVAWQNEMRRAVIVEMRAEIDRLWRRCQ